MQQKQYKGASVSRKLPTLKKKKRSHINSLTLHLKEEEKEQTKPKISKRKEITNIIAEINKIKNRKSMKLIVVF